MQSGTGEKDAGKRESGIQFPSSVLSFLFLVHSLFLRRLSWLMLSAAEDVRGAARVQQRERERRAAESSVLLLQTCCQSCWRNEGAMRAGMKLKENFILIPSSLSFHFRLSSCLPLAFLLPLQQRLLRVSLPTHSGQHTTCNEHSMCLPSPPPLPRSLTRAVFPLLISKGSGCDPRGKGQSIVS